MGTKFPCDLLTMIDMAKTVLVTGSSRGIGRAVALAFGRAGYNVVFHGNKNAALCADAAKSLEGHCKTACVFGDISSAAGASEVANAALKAFGGVDILVNNAGVADIRMLCDVTEADYNGIMDVNVKGAVFAAKAVLAHMVSQKAGRIINISSMWGDMGASCETVYSASKAAIEGFTKALAKEVGLSNITVNAIAAGFVQTDMNAALGADAANEIKNASALGSLPTAEDIAATALFLASDAARAITGQVIRVDAGYNI